MTSKPSNPFLTNCYDGRWSGATGVEDRLAMIKTFTLDECRRAMALDNVQKSVYGALVRRICKLEKTP